MEESNLKRAANFSEDEIDILNAVVEKYKNAIDCRSKRTNSNKLKDMAWVQIAKDFNNISMEFYRGPKTLRIKYKNLKKKSQEFCQSIKKQEELNNTDMEITKHEGYIEYESADENDFEFADKDLESGNYSEENAYRKAIKFTSREKKCLLSLVEKFKDRIESKKLDSESINLKNLAWLQLAEEYNEIIPGTYRGVKALRMKYKNMKRERKLRKALDNIEENELNNQHEDNNVEFIIIDSSASKYDGEEIVEDQDEIDWADADTEIVNHSNEPFANGLMYDYDGEDELIDTTKCDISEENILKRQKYSLEISLLKQQLQQEKVKKSLLVQKHEKEMENLELQNQKLKLELEILQTQNK